MSILDQVITKAQSTIPMRRQIQSLHLATKAKRLLVGDNQPHFVEEDIPDVDEVALTDIDMLSRSQPSSVMISTDASSSRSRRRARSSS